MKTSKGGWVKLHRKIMNWEWYDEPKTTRLFIHLLLKASHNDFRWRGLALKKGQLPFGYAKTSKETGLSIQSIRTAINKLKITNEITIETSRQGSVITILKWESYQLVTHDSTADQRQNNNEITTTKNIINKEIKNNICSHYRVNEAALDQIYSVYPKKKGKAVGYQKLKKYITSEKKFQEVLEGARNYAKECKVKKIDQQYITLFSTWVNQQRWKDTYETVSSGMSEWLQEYGDDN